MGGRGGGGGGGLHVYMYEGQSSENVMRLQDPPQVGCLSTHTVKSTVYGQELIEPAREHVTTIDSEIQTWRSDHNFSNYQIWLTVVCACSVYTWGCKQILQSMIANGGFEKRLLQELGEDTASSMRL